MLFDTVARRGIFIRLFLFLLPNVVVVALGGKDTLLCKKNPGTQIHTKLARYRND